MNNDELFEEFLEGYFKNIKRELPESFRAQQLNGSETEKGLVRVFETRFLKEPFMKALEQARTIFLKEPAIEALKQKEVKNEKIRNS